MQWGLTCKEEWITTKSRCFRPTSWPPPHDWPVYESRDGTDVDCWSSTTWRLAGSGDFLNFGDDPVDNGQVDSIDTKNANLLRITMTWLMFGPGSLKSAATLLGAISRLRPLFVLSSQEGILANELMRFPRVFEKLPERLAASSYQTLIAELHRLYDARTILGFVLVDKAGLKRLAAAKPDYDPVQTPYIPPRIWSYQVARLKECLDDFLAHKAQVEACLTFCADHYAINHRSLDAAYINVAKGQTVYNPFNSSCAMYSWCTYLGSFDETAKKFGIYDLLERWRGKPGKTGMHVKMFSAYLGLVSFAAAAYIANFTLQRKEEINALRMDCMTWEDDPIYGRVPIICGETTKTDPDSDARWVSSPTVAVAFDAASFITRLQMPLMLHNPNINLDPKIAVNPYLLTARREPWGTGKTVEHEQRRRMNHVAAYLKLYPKLFDKEQLRITEDDLKIARQLTPNLPETEFSVGNVWPTAWHQFRRTGAVNMFASKIVSDSSMQWLLKHLTEYMPIYYGRNHRRLRLNGEVEGAVITEMYRSLSLALLQAMGDRYVSPHSPEQKQSMVVNLISVKDIKQFEKYARNGSASFRLNLLGGCMKGGACEYGGYETIAHCAGADGGKPCSHLLYDRELEPQIRADISKIEQEMLQLPKDCPRYRYLLAERQGRENYLNVVTNS